MKLLFSNHTGDKCPDAYCDENNILRGAKPVVVGPKYEGPWCQDGLTNKEKKKRMRNGAPNRQ